MSGSSAPPSTTQTTTTKLNPQQEQLYNMAFPFASQYASKPMQQFPGTGIVDFSPEEMAAQQGYRTAAGTDQDLAQRAATAQKFMMDPAMMLDPNNNPYLQRSASAVTDLTTRNFLQNVLPNVRGGVVANEGMYSGGSSKGAQAEALATSETGKNLSGNLADMMYKAYSGGLGTMQNAVGMNPGVMQQQLTSADVLGAVGAQNRSMDQAKLDEQIRRYYTDQEWPLLRAQELFGLISGMPGASTTSTGTGAVPPTNPWMSTLGGAGSGAAFGSMFGPWGTAIGGGIGGLAGYLSSRR